MKEEINIICRRVVDSVHVISGSIKLKCKYCGEPVYMAPTSVDLVANKNYTVQCDVCIFDGDIFEIIIKSEPLTPEQIKELKKTIFQDNMKERRN